MNAEEYMDGIPEQVVLFCKTEGYTEPFKAEGRWWGFPPNGVMPLEIPARCASARDEAYTVRVGGIEAVAISSTDSLELRGQSMELLGMDEARSLSWMSPSEVEAFLASRVECRESQRLEEQLEQLKARLLPALAIYQTEYYTLCWGGQYDLPIVPRVDPI